MVTCIWQFQVENNDKINSLAITVLQSQMWLMNKIVITLQRRCKFINKITSIIVPNYKKSTLYCAINDKQIIILIIIINPHGGGGGSLA